MLCTRTPCDIGARETSFTTGRQKKLVDIPCCALHLQQQWRRVMRPRMIMRWRAWHPSVVAAALRAISVVLATGCHLRSADTSTTVFPPNDLDRRESPLAVLWTKRSGDGTPASSSLEIFSEDLNWVSKVLGFLRSRQATAELQCSVGTYAYS